MIKMTKTVTGGRAEVIKVTVWGCRRMTVWGQGRALGHSGSGYHALRLASDVAMATVAPPSQPHNHGDNDDEENEEGEHNTRHDNELKGRENVLPSLHMCKASYKCEHRRMLARCKQVFNYYLHKFPID